MQKFFNGKMKNNRLRITYERSMRVPENQKIVEAHRCTSIKRAHDIIHRGNRAVRSAMFKDYTGREHDLGEINFYNYSK